MNLQARKLTGSWGQMWSILPPDTLGQRAKAGGFSGWLEMFIYILGMSI
jgi:hypothetical protein